MSSASSFQTASQSSVSFAPHKIQLTPVAPVGTEAEPSHTSALMENTNAETTSQLQQTQQKHNLNGSEWQRMLTMKQAQLVSVLQSWMSQVRKEEEHTWTVMPKSHFEQ